MSSFVSLPPLTDTAPNDPAPPEMVANDGFWPDINLVELREAVRLDTTISPARLADSVSMAMLDLARRLQTWRTANAGAAANLQAVTPRREIGGQSDYVLLYTRALYSLVGADLGERLLSQSATNQGADRADALRAEVGEHRRNASWAVSDFLGRRRATIELI